MTTELARPNALPETMAAWLGGLSPTSATAYLKALAAFANFTGATTSGEAVANLLAGTRGDAARAADGFKAAMMQRGLSSATINLRLSAIRSVVESARRHGLVEWTLDVDGLKSEARRDSRGCTWEQYEAVLAAAPTCRERAILLLLGDRGLRRSEVAALTIDDVGAGEVFVLGKGRREREPLAVNPRTIAALACWLDERGTETGLLFGVAQEQIHAIVVAAGKRVGVVLRPHGLRHASVTRALDLTAGNVRMVQQFARHSSPVTTMKYDDARHSHASAVVQLVGGHNAVER